MAISSSTVSYDQEKFLVSKLVSRLHLRLVASGLCEKIKQPKGTGTTAYFVRYKRMNVPLATLTEGTDPSASSFTLEQFTVALDQWGDIVEITDLAELTAKHPLMQEALNLLAENAQRVIDREIQNVWLSSSSVQYGDGSVATRRLITTSLKLSDSVIHKALVTLKDAGAVPRGGPSGGVQVEAASPSGNITGGSAFVAVCGPHVLADLMASGTSLGTFASVAMYANQKALYNNEVGTWLGVRFVETNFIPKFTLLGNGTTAAAAGADAGGITGLTTANVASGGTLTSATTYYWKVTRKDLLRGFEEAISIAHSTSSGGTGDNEAMTFTLPSTAGYVYNVYFDTVQGGGTGTDATMKLVAQNQAASAVVTVSGVPASGATPPDNIKEATSNPTTVHPIYILGQDACQWVGLQNLEFMITKDESIIGNVLRLKRACGFKFMSKAIVPDSNRLLRVEVASAFG